MNLSLLSSEFSAFGPGKIVAGSLILAKKMLKVENLSIEEILEDFGVKKNDVEIVAKLLLFMLKDGFVVNYDGGVLDACKRKFGVEEYDFISDIEISIVER